MKIFQFIFLIALSLHAYEDLGVYGELYPIKERDFMELLKEKEAALDKKQLLEDMKKEATQSLIIRSHLSTCEKTQQRIYEPTINLKKDIVLPFEDEVAHKKGTYNILKEQNLLIPYNVIFIDADDELQVELAGMYKQQLKQKIRILVVKGDYLKFISNPLFEYAKVARDKFEVKAFNVQCLPSIYTQQEYRFVINEYNPKELLYDKNKKN